MKNSIIFCLFLFVLNIYFSQSTSYIVPRVFNQTFFDSAEIFGTSDDYSDYEFRKEKIASPEPNCSFSFNNDTGEVKSPGYPDSYPDEIICEWSITVKPNMSILLTVNGIELRILDRIIVYDGPNKEHNILSHYRKYGTNYNSVSSKNQMFIQFHSKKHYYLSDKTSFSLQYKAISHGCGIKYKDDEGVIFSPNYPNNYPDNIKCVWDITTNINKNIILIFDEFDLVTGDTMDVGYSKTITGNHIPSNLISSGHYLGLQLTTDTINSGKGFKLRFKTKEWDSNCTFMIFATNAIIRAQNSETKTITINGHKITKQTNYDFRKNTFIWFEPESHQINIQSLNSSAKSLTLNGKPNSLALNYVLDHLYWIDINSKTINVMDINDDNNNIYIVSELKDQNPIDLIINMKKSILVWSDLGIEPKIWYSDLDGSKQNILYSNSRQSLHLTIDYQKERYFFIDIIDHSLYSIDFDGNNETFFIKSTEYFDAINKMIVLDNDIYLANDHMIYRIPEIDLQIQSIQILFKTHRYSSFVDDKAVEINRQWINSFEIESEIIEPLFNYSHCISKVCKNLCLPNSFDYKCLDPYTPQNSSQTSPVIHNYSTKFDGLEAKKEPEESLSKLSVFNTLLIILLLVFNVFLAFVIFRYVYNKRVYQIHRKSSSTDTRLPLEGIDNQVISPTLHSVSQENLLNLEDNSNV